MKKQKKTEILEQLSFNLETIEELGKIMQKGISSIKNIIYLLVLLFLSYHFNIQYILILLLIVNLIRYLYNMFKYIKWKKKLLK